MSEISKYPLIYCSTCGGTKPLLIDEMQADHLNDHDAADLMCSECHSIVATLHALPAGSSGERK